MAKVSSYPKGLGPREVKTWHSELKSIYDQERRLLDFPLADFRQYSFSLVGGVVVKNTVLENLEVECAVPNLDQEVIANSGGLVLPTDREMTVYDFNPNILSVVEWPSGSGNLFTIQAKEYMDASGRCDMWIRQGNHLKGVIYRRVKAQAFGGGNWTVTETTEDICVTTHIDSLDMRNELLFSGISAQGDKVFWALKESFVLAGNAPFVPSIRDILIDKDHLGHTETYRIVETIFDARENYYKLLARAYEEV